VATPQRQDSDGHGGGSQVADLSSRTEERDVDQRRGGADGQGRKQP
jgi:hypothetical protein